MLSAYFRSHQHSAQSGTTAVASGSFLCQVSKSPVCFLQVEWHLFYSWIAFGALLAHPGLYLFHSPQPCRVTRKCMAVLPPGGAWGSVSSWSVRGIWWVGGGLVGSGHIWVRSLSCRGHKQGQNSLVVSPKSPLLPQKNWAAVKSLSSLQRG